MGQPQTKSYNELFGLLKERHVKKAILPMRRDAFLKARQKGSQTVDEWQTDVCKLAVECEFGTLLESMMLTVFLGGLRDDRLRIHLHAKELTTLWEAVDAARLYEAQRCLPPDSTQQEQPQEVYALNQRWQGQQRTWKGRSQTDSESDSSGEDPSEQKTQHKERGKSFPGRCFNCNEYGHRASACKKSKKRKAELNAIYALQETSLAYLTLRAGESKVRFQVDTGTTLTVFTNEDWYAIGRPRLKAPSYEARSYSGHAVKLKGEMELNVFLRGRRHRLKAFVADDVEHSIMGREWLTLVDGWEQFKEQLKEQPDFKLQQGRIEYVNFVKRAIPRSQQQRDVSSSPPSRDDSLRRRLLLQDVSSSPPSRDDSFRRRLQRTTSLRRCANRHHLPTQVKSLLPLQPLQNDSPLPPSRDDSSSSLPTLKDLLPSLPSQPSWNDSLSLPPTLDYLLPPQPLRDASSPSLPSRGRLPPPTLNDRPLVCSTLLDCLLPRARRKPSTPKSKEKGRKRKKKLAELAEEVAELNQDTAEDPPV
uniref:CCHC-type domain-containing protein n=1 Tax=Plectus sambesii TaxID=2011161 RepID=A0A914VKV9_9BILA